MSLEIRTTVQWPNDIHVLQFFVEVQRFPAIPNRWEEIAKITIGTEYSYEGNDRKDRVIRYKCPSMEINPHLTIFANQEDWATAIRTAIQLAWNLLSSLSWIDGKLKDEEAMKRLKDDYGNFPVVQQ